MMNRKFERENINDLPLRVTFFARVSTNQDTSANHIDDQIASYKEFINSHPNWVYVEGYIDEAPGIAALTKKTSLNRMIEDAKAGCFDLVITKDCTRFGRNIVNSISYTRELMSNGVAVLFQNDGFSTLDYDAELRLGIMLTFATAQ